jgi:hypothetical protein
MTGSGLSLQVRRQFVQKWWQPCYSEGATLRTWSYRGLRTCGCWLREGSITRGPPSERPTDRCIRPCRQATQDSDQAGE